MQNGAVMSIFDIIVRSVLSVITLFTLTRIMGRKQIAQLTFFDYVVGISIGSIAATFAVDNTIAYFHGMTALIIYALFPIGMSFVSLKSIKFRKWLGGTPTVLIQNGKFVEKNLKKAKFHVNHVLEECRMKGAFNVADVEFAVLETSGQVSIQLKSQKQPISPQDLKIPTPYKGLSADVIIDGKVMHEHLKLVHLDENWLANEVKKQKITSFDEILLATLDTSGKLYIHLKNHDPKPLDVLE